MGLRKSKVKKNLPLGLSVVSATGSGGQSFQSKLANREYHPPHKKGCEQLTICKCDRCGKTIQRRDEVFCMRIGLYQKPLEASAYELCEWCYRCLIDWVKADG